MPIPPSLLEMIIFCNMQIADTCVQPIRSIVETIERLRETAFAVNNSDRVNLNHRKIR